MNHPHVIGVVAGVGPLAGLDLLRKLVAQTAATIDQQHLPVLSISRPGQIPDRTAFLLGRATDNPAYPILEQLDCLSRMGATVAGIPCNTAHAPAIWEVIEEGVKGFPRPLRLLHMIEEVATHLAATLPDCHTVGLLATTGTIQARVYPQLLEPRGWQVLVPDPALQEAAVHPAIYDTSQGIKARGATAWARTLLWRAAADLSRQGAEAIILGCTEIPLVLTEAAVGNTPLIDPTLLLARALIREAAPDQLRQMNTASG